MRRTRYLFAFLGLLVALPLRAQEDKVPQGVRLRLVYQTGYRPKLAVRPLQADGIAAQAGEDAYDILSRDLDYSDRFEMATTPLALATGAVNYKAWNDLGVVYLVTGQVQPTASGYTLRLTLHDVVYGDVKQNQTFELPPAGDAAFRLAVHAVSDEVVRWVTGEPGAAATRIVFRRSGPNGQELMMVDADGENLHRVASVDGFIFSPTWSPDGSRLMYAQQSADGAAWRIVERTVDTGRTRTITEGRDAALYTPTYAPDGEHIAYARWDGKGMRIYSYDAGSGCCLKRLTAGPRDDVSPSYSPDGRRIVFNSSRLGQPHIYVMPADGGEATLLSPFVYGEPGYYTSADWSPTGSQIVFHGRSRGNFQIMLADAAKPGDTVQQITSEGVSEDPSFAPDGRHIVFAGARDGRWGLYVIDSVTGRLRPLVVGGGKYELPDWSPGLMKAPALAGGG